MKYYITVINESKVKRFSFTNYIIRANFIVKNRNLYLVVDNTFSVNIYSTNKPRIIYAEKVRRILIDKIHESMYRAGFTTLQAAEENLVKHYIHGYDFLLEDDKSIIEVV